jgi:rSAM/selenodomain-associated transferase 1
MYNNGAIAVFVKTPGLSPVKTRLAVHIGQQKAEAFHLASARSVSSVVKVLGEQRALKSYYAVAEKEAVSHPFWQDLPCVWQGEGGLGERMALIYDTLLATHDFVILVGADIPQMTSAELLKAVDWLSASKSNQLAFAPSVDGGFWLFGGNCAIPHSVWTEVAYSQAETGSQFLNRINKIGDVKILASLRDVDELDDLIALHQTLLDLPILQPEQRVLIQFLRGLIPLS